MDLYERRLRRDFKVESNLDCGGLTEWFKVAVLKTVVRESVP